MARYRDALPQMSGDLFLTDGGIETTLIFHDGPHAADFAAFELLNTPEGEAALRKYFGPTPRSRNAHGTGLILESATWRASADWGKRLGYTPEALAELNRKAVALLEEHTQRIRERSHAASSSADASGRAATATFPARR